MDTPSRPSFHLSLFTCLSLLTAFHLGGSGSASAAGVELIKNGGFESGNLSRWTVVTSGAFGTFFKSAVGTTTPTSTNATAANPKGGTSYAVSDQNNVSFQTLSQKFRVPRDARRVILSYQMFVYSGATVVINPAGFSTAAGANQHARVDLLNGTASPLNTTNGVVQRLYTQGADVSAPTPPPAPYRTYRFNITRKAKPGKTYRIRFGANVSSGPINLGVDNVSVKAF